MALGPRLYDLPPMFLCSKFQIIGMFLAVLAGCVFPLMSLILTDMMNVLGALSYDLDKVCAAACRGLGC
jgi:hypothetical protein